MAPSAPFALKAGEWFRRARLLMVSPDSRAYRARRQAETPLSVLCRFPGPALTALKRTRSKTTSVGAWQQVTDGHPDPIGSIEKQRVSELHFSLHCIPAGWHPV